jgi:plastocyanin
MMRLLFFLLTLLPLSPSAPTGSVSGRVALIKNGAPLRDASNAVVWIEGLHRAGEGVSRAAMKSEKKKFTPRVVVVSREGLVDFPNVDPIYHNVFSVSRANRFDLGLYRAGASKEKKFEEPGLVRVYCNIHPQMVGFVVVVDSDFAVVTSPDGSFRFDGVPAGSHRLRVWHEEGGEATEIPIAVRARAETPVEARLDATDYRAQPHKNKYGKDYSPLAGSDDERY